MKTFSFLIACLGGIFFFPYVHAQENVGIGTSTPMYRLDIQGNPASAITKNLYSKVNYVGNTQIRAVDGYSVPANGFGYGGFFTGGFVGAYGEALSGNYNSTAYGLYGIASGTLGNRIGVYGTASGATTNYGVYGIATGGAGYYGVFGANTNLAGYAGYFSGRGHFTQELRADKNLVVDDTTWTTRIWNIGGVMSMKSLSDMELMIDREDNGAGISFFEIFNGAGNHVFYVNEVGNGRVYGNYIVDGELGVGTTSPVTRLHVATGSDLDLDGLGYAQLGVTSGTNLVLDNNEILARTNGAGTDLYLQHDGGDLILCGQELGGVGIGVLAGTSIPVGYLLAVDGRVIAEELRIENSGSWPDYVFSEHYDLMPLEQLKATIQSQKHLPNIPPASVVEAEGFLVGDMQVRMMEKIEELTLYILELHESNKQQQAEIEQLRLQMASLQKQE